MRKKLLAAVLAVLVGSAALFSVPEIRVRRFVFLHRDGLEKACQTETVPAGIGYKSYNFWEREHIMLEFILFTRGYTYYGCYYSPDDVPLPFQNVETGLTQTGDTDWIWQGEGDNHGKTSKIADGWYYFEASF